MIAVVVAGAAAQEADTSLWGPTLAVGLVAAVVALFTLAANQVRARKDRQRELFADAFAAVTEYREFPFIVRRRDEKGADRQAIARDLSAVQAKLNQYIARLQIEAPRVGREYGGMVTETRRVAGKEIARSWDTEPPGTTGAMHVRDIDLSVLDVVEGVFLLEVADHLTLTPGWARRATRAAWAWLRLLHLGRRSEPVVAAHAARVEARQ